MDELIEQVARVIRDSIDVDGDSKLTWHDYRAEAIAAIRAVRAFDLTVGPNEAEIEAAMKASTGYWGNGATSCAEVLTRASKAAAAERARVAEEVG